MAELLLDCRPQSDYMQGHLQGVANIPSALLSQRLFQLPSNDYPLRLLGDRQSLLQATEVLQQKSYTIADSQLITPALLQQWQEQGMLERGDQRYRLWRASSIVQSWLELKLPAKTGLDIACGAGRDSVFLAQHGMTMTALDYLPRNIAKARLLAEYYHCQLNLQLADAELYQAKQKFDLILVVRYLHRPLLQRLSSWLNPGGSLVYQTFMQGAEHFGSPKNPQHLLQEGELAQCFSDLTVLHDKIHILPDGRPISHFIAQKT